MPTDRRRGGVAAGLLALLLGAAPGLAGPPGPQGPSPEEIGSIQVLMTPAQALAQAFPGAAHVDTVGVMIGEGGRHAARGAGGFAADSTAVYIARDAAGAVLGLAVVGDEIGKYRPITFMVAVDSELRLTRVAILVYRESRGGQVRRSRFLRQYRGKDIHDPIRINRDIVNITGATLSVRALNTGVRKALRLLERVRQESGPTGASPNP